MNKKRIVFYIIFGIISVVISSILSCIIANLIAYVYSPNPQEIMNLTPKIMFTNLIDNKNQFHRAINQLFWVAMCCFGFLIMATKLRRLFGLKDYKTDVYEVTKDIKIPVPVGDKQTQQGSSWWLDKKDFETTFNSNNINPTNPTIKKILHNADIETKLIKEYQIPYKIIDGVKIIDEEKLRSELKEKYKNLEKIEISPDEMKIFKKGGIVLGRNIKKVKGVETENVLFVADNVHTLTVGATRSGKTRCLVIQSIMNSALAGESMVMSDPKGELFEYTAGGLKQLGYNVVTLDFKNPKKSSYYNFLQPVINELKKGNLAEAQMKASDICESIVGEAKGEKIWNDGEKATIKTGIMSVCMEAPENMQNMANVYYFLANLCKENEKGELLMDYFLDRLKNGYFDEEKQIAVEGNPNHPAIASFAPSSIASSKTRSSFYTSALNSLTLFSDSYIASMTSKTDIKAEDLANKKTALFMILPDEKLTYYSLCSLFVSQIYQQLVNIADNNGGTLNNRVNFILDEFGNFSAIPNFGGFLTVGGGRGIRFNLFLQSFSQLNSKYDENTAQNILDNCHIWNYLKTSNDTTAEKISKKLGTYTCASYSESNSANKGSSSINQSKSMSLTQRALLTPAEVLMINRPYLLVMFSGNKPAMTNSPDLSKWLFNRMLSLGDPEFCTKVRIVREAMRDEVEDVKIPLWNIEEQLLRQKQKEKEGRRNRSERADLIRQNAQMRILQEEMQKKINNTSNQSKKKIKGFKLFKTI